MGAPKEEEEDDDAEAEAEADAEAVEVEVEGASPPRSDAPIALSRVAVCSMKSRAEPCG